MKTSERFTNAVTKLYNAFHEGKLNAMDCEACAVGNIVGGSYWSSFLKDYCLCEEHANYAKLEIKNSGYSGSELLNIEIVFMRKAFEQPSNIQTKESKFKGLCAVVEYLCELDGIPNVMDYTCLFETKNNTPKVKLEEVFVY